MERKKNNETLDKKRFFRKNRKHVCENCDSNRLALLISSICLILIISFAGFYFYNNTYSKDFQIQTIEEFLDMASQNQYTNFKNEKIGIRKEIDIVGEPTFSTPTKNKKVTIVEFSDYECPYCKLFNDNVLKKFKEEYKNDIIFVFKDFPLNFHTNAKPAAIAANCVHKEMGNEAYFEFHDKLFDNQKSFNDETYLKYALEVGVNQDKFRECILDPSILDEIDEDLREGAELGVSGTPSIFVNGKKILTYEYDEFVKTVEEELQK